MFLYQLLGQYFECRICLVLNHIAPQIKKAPRCDRDALRYGAWNFLEQGFADLELRFNLRVVGDVGHYYASICNEGRVEFFNSVEI